MTYKTKRIAAITMARNDEFFLSRWIEYYGAAFGKENLYIYLDGTDQVIPKNAGAAHIKKLPHTPMSRAAGDKYRIDLISDMAADLFARGYDVVIGCDTDEFLVIDPGFGMTLREYLSRDNLPAVISGLGLDVGQHMENEKTINPKKPLLDDRGYALLSTRYTKPVVLTRPARWGRGFHRVKSHNFHLDKNLYLLHFGAIDMEMLKQKAAARGADWVAHLNRRGNGTIDAVTNSRPRGDAAIKFARILQRIARPIYAWNKPGMLGLKIVVKIPENLRKIKI